MKGSVLFVTDRGESIRCIGCICRFLVVRLHLALVLSWVTSCEWARVLDFGVLQV